MPSRVDTTSPAVRTAVEAMLTLVVAGGAEVHPRLCVVERHGQLSVHAAASDGEMLIRLPEDLLVPVDGVTWGVSDDQLSIMHHDPTATPAQRDLADAHVAVYNATGKINWARTSLPAVALCDDPAAVAAVRLLRPGFGLHPRPTAEAFINTRLYHQAVAPTTGGPTVAEQGRGVLMPVIDLLNHHPRGTPFQISDGAMTVPVMHAADDTQCFVRYGSRRDPLDLALQYGYADPTVRFARSLRLSVEVAGVGTVAVAGQRPSVRSTLDPPTISMEPGKLSLSHVTFHAGHPERMMAVLQLAVAAYLARYERAPHDAPAATKALVTAVAAANLSQLDAANARLEGSTVDAAGVVVAAIQVQRSIIERVLGHLSTWAPISRHVRD